MNWEEFLEEVAARADKNSRDDWTNVEGSNEPFSSLSCNPFSPERFFFAGPLRSYWLPVSRSTSPMQWKTPALFSFFFFSSPSFLCRSSPSSQFSRRIIASSIRLYTRFHTKSLTSLIFSEKNKNIYIFRQRDDKKRKKKRK